MTKKSSEYEIIQLDFTQEEYETVKRAAKLMGKTPQEFCQYTLDNLVGDLETMFKVTEKAIDKNKGK